MSSCLLPRARVLVFAEPADMRKGHDGLCGLIREAGEDPLSGALFVFLSRRGDRAKVLSFERGGLVLFYKRLERGRFKHPTRGASSIAIDTTSLMMLLDGIDVRGVRRPRLWSPEPIDNRPAL